ncbi:hypothetical protein IW262DRAFT_1231857, partial [Armillaria fumosa]
LHLHIIIWIKNCLSLQQIRDHLMSVDSEFRIRLIQYLESVHKGEFFTGTQAAVSNMRFQETLAADYVDFTQVLPDAPPPHCDNICSTCSECKSGNTTETWWAYFRRMVDMIISKCNVHTCKSNTWADSTLKRNANAKGCMDNKWGKCKARFPHKIFQETCIDDDTGHINVKKKEAWINTFAATLSFVFRCNTDVTSLRSGTAIKAVLIYVTDYITKPGLKTHAIFDCIRAVFQR